MICGGIACNRFAGHVCEEEVVLFLGRSSSDDDHAFLLGGRVFVESVQTPLWRIAEKIRSDTFNYGCRKR